MKSQAAPKLRSTAAEQDLDEILKRLEPVLKLSESDMVGLVPDRSGIYFVGCPNCTGGTQEGQISWTIDRPHEVFCRHCGIPYPNEKYPDNQVLHVKNPVGLVQDYPCYEAPDPPPRPRPASTPQPGPGEGYRYFFQAKGWYLARAFFEQAAQNLGLAYHLTGDRSLARRAAQILNRFAQVYPGYCVHYDLPFIQKIIFSGDQKSPFPVEPYRAAKWDWWAYMDIPERAIRAYDLIRESGELDEAMKRRIEVDLFRGSVDFVRAIPVLLTNMDPTLLRGLIAAGLVLEDPDYIHDAVDRIQRLIKGQFFVDGMWREGAISYHNQTVGGLTQLADMLQGYSDPRGYVHPKDGEHFDTLDLIGRFPILDKARKVPSLMRYPNGRVVAFHDTWAREGREPRGESGPVLLTGAGQVRLGRGRGLSQMEAHLHYSGGYGHQHADLLSLTLYSHGQERLSDIGYTHTRHRCWTLCTPCHNTVTVDGLDQAYGSERVPTDGNLLLYVPGDETFQAVEASGDRAYPGLTRTYRRSLVMVGVSPEEAYVVDLFRVSGGGRHEYALVGDSDHDGTLETGLDLTGYGATMLPSGVHVRFPTGESVRGDAEGHNIAYAFIRDVRRATPAGPWTLTFRSEATPGAAVRVHATPDDGTEVFVGTAPSVRRAGEDDGRVDDFTMPIAIARREGKDLSSSFVRVLEPFSGSPFIRSVERLPVMGVGPDDVAIRISHSRGTDILILRLDGEGTAEAGGVTLEGRVGLVREADGIVKRATLVGGRRLSRGPMALQGQGTASGEVVRTLRRASGDSVDGLAVEGAPGLGEWVKGLTVVVRDGGGFSQGFEISGFVEGGGERILALKDDPGFELKREGKGQQCFFPNRSWTGGARFEVASVATITHG